MRALRALRQEPAERDIRMTVPDPRRDEVRARVADATARLFPLCEAEALAWIEAVSDFDERDESSEAGPPSSRHWPISIQETGEEWPS